MDISDVSLGSQLTVMWNGRPIFIRHRTDQEIEEARAEDINNLIDNNARNPNIADVNLATDANRAVPNHDKFLIMIGICTHLGCVPLGDGAGDFGGWFCPCHGSHYDTAGRIRKGPAPENLHIPILSVTEEMVLSIG